MLTESPKIFFERIIDALDNYVHSEMQDGERIRHQDLKYIIRSICPEWTDSNCDAFATLYASVQPIFISRRGHEGGYYKNFIPEKDNNKKNEKLLPGVKRFASRF